MVQLGYFYYIGSPQAMIGVLNKFRDQVITAEEERLPINFYLLIREEDGLDEFLRHHGFDSVLTLKRVKVFRRREKFNKMLFFHIEALKVLEVAFAENEAIVSRWFGFSPFFYRRISEMKSKWKRIFITEHHGNELEELKRRSKLAYFVEKFSADRCWKMIDGFIAVSESIAKMQLDRMNDENRRRFFKRYVVIPNGIRPDSMDICEIARWKKLENDITVNVGFVGAYPSEKFGLEHLILAFLNSNYNLELNIAGDAESWLKYFKRLAEMGIFLMSIEQEEPVVLKFSNVRRSRNKPNVRVMLNGFISRSSACKFFSKVHVAAAPLGVYSHAMPRMSSLKAIEYAARGVPFFMVGEDENFIGCKWVLSFRDLGRLRADRVVDFVREAHENLDRVQRELRTWIEKNVSWRVKLPKYIEFAKKLVEETSS